MERTRRLTLTTLLLGATVVAAQTTTLRATGVGTAPSVAKTPREARANAEKQALADALRILAAKARHVEFEGQRVGDMADGNSSAQILLRSILERDYRVAKRRYFSDGSLEVDVEMPVSAVTNAARAIQNAESELPRSVLLPASPATTSSILGRGLTTDLHEFPSGNNEDTTSSPRSDPVVIETRRFNSTWEETSGGISAAVDASLAGVLGIKAQAGKQEREATLTVYEIHRVERLGLGERTLPARVPKGPTWLATEVWYGWSLTYRFTSNQAGGSLSLALSKLTSKGALTAALENEKVATRVTSIGLESVSTETAPIVLELSDVQKSFRTTGEPEPIFVKYERLQSVAVPQENQGATQ